MNIVRNISAVVIGVIACLLLNGGILSLGSTLIPPPPGVNVNDLESLKASMHLFEAKHFIVPFLAHAVGSVVGGLLAALIAASHKMTFAIVIGVVHLLGGIVAAIMIPSPTWFIVLDLVVAYLPMAWIGGKLGSKIGSSPATT